MPAGKDHAPGPDAPPNKAAEGCCAESERQKETRNLRWKRRLCALAVLVLAATPLAAAAWASPDARGYDTHTALGLPPCGFPIRWGLPCPTCGMTTAFSWLVRGRILKAAQTQLFGALLGAACVVWSLAAVVQLVSGRAVLVRVAPRRSWLLPAAALLMAAWALKVALMTAGAP